MHIDDRTYTPGLDDDEDNEISDAEFTDMIAECEAILTNSASNPFMQFRQEITDGNPNLFISLKSMFTDRLLGIDDKKNLNQEDMIMLLSYQQLCMKESVFIISGLQQGLDDLKKKVAWLHRVFKKNYVHYLTGTQLESKILPTGSDKITVLIRKALQHGFTVDLAILDHYTRDVYLAKLGFIFSLVDAHGLDLVQTKQEVDYLWSNNFTAVTHYEELFLRLPGSHDLFRFLATHPQAFPIIFDQDNIMRYLTVGSAFNASSSMSVHRFKGILEMIKSRDDLVLPAPGVDWEEKRTEIIRIYKHALIYKLSLDYRKDDKGKLEQIPQNSTFDHVFCAMATQDYAQRSKKRDSEIVYTGGEDRNGAFETSNKDKACLKKLTQEGRFHDYSSTYQEGQLLQTNPQRLIDEVKKCVQQNPAHTVLVYIGYHGADGNALPFTKKHLHELTNISPNVRVKIRMCGFGDVYDDINTLLSPVSGSSGKHLSYGDRMFFDGLRKGFGFHKAELYNLYRNPMPAFAPMTENVEYMDTKKSIKQKKKVSISEKSADEHRFSTIG